MRWYGSDCAAMGFRDYVGDDFEEVTWCAGAAAELSSCLDYAFFMFVFFFGYFFGGLFLPAAACFEDSMELDSNASRLYRHRIGRVYVQDACLKS